MAKIVIIGAGLTGLSTAYHLEKKGFYDYAIFEKESSVGGLCRSVHQDGFTFDFTGHLLHINDKYFHNMIEQTVGLEQFNTITRRSFIYSHKTYTRYPFQVNLYGLPPSIITQCIEGFVKRKKSRGKAQSFQEWVLKSFGTGFGRHFFFPYQKKILACDITKLTASWTKNFVPSTSLEQIIQGAITDNHDETIGYNANFFYPKRGGIFFWVEKFAQQIANPIRTNFCVDTVDLHSKTVHFTNGHREPYDILVNTIPLDRLLCCLKDRPSTLFRQARKHLRCNSVINFNLGINRPNLSEKHWIYFPESAYPFYRIGFPHNFSSTMAPPNCSALYGEFSHINKSSAWVNKTLKQALDATKNLLKIDTRDIVTEKVINISHAYVIYDFWREHHLPKLLTRLKEHQIYCVGRYGEWKYASMQDAVLDGKQIANTLCIMPAKQAHKVGIKPKSIILHITQKEKSYE